MQELKSKEEIDKKSKRLLLENQLDDLKKLKMNYDGKIMKYTHYYGLPEYTCLINHYKKALEDINKDIKEIEKELEGVR